MPAKVHAVYALIVAFSVGLFVAAVSAEAQGDSSSPKKFASAVLPLKSKPVAVYSNIALEEARLSDHTVAPIGFPLGELEFIIQPGESVDLVDIFYNDGESGYTFKVRNRSGESGFILDGPLDVTEWIGDRGALLRVLTGQPYEYDGGYSTDCPSRMELIEELEEFISKHASSQYIAFAELAILGTKCYSIPDTLQEVWHELGDLKEGRAIGSRGTRINAWTAEVNRLYSALEKRESARLQELFDFCDLVGKLKESVPSPVGSLEESQARLGRATIKAAPASSISGDWVLRPEGQPDSFLVTSQQMKMQGSRLMVSGDGWQGEGEFDGRRGYYDWTFTDGRTGRTEIFLDGEGVLHGKVRGSGIDWDYQATRQR